MWRKNLNHINIQNTYILFSDQDVCIWSFLSVKQTLLQLWYYNYTFLWLYPVIMQTLNLKRFGFCFLIADEKNHGRRFSFECLVITISNGKFNHDKCLLRMYFFLFNCLSNKSAFTTHLVYEVKINLYILIIKI